MADEHETVIRAGEEGRLEPGAAFEDARFEGLALVEASLRDASFVDCTFTGCDLTLASMDGATVRGVRFERCRLLGIDVGAWRDDALGIEARFVDCDLDRLQAANVDLRACAFEDGRAREAAFERCDLRGVAFEGIELSGARFEGCDLRDADLRGARGYAIDATRNRVAGTRVALPEALSFLAVLGLRLEG